MSTGVWCGGSLSEQTDLLVWHNTLEDSDFQNVVYIICSLEENEFTLQFTQLHHAFYYTMEIFWPVTLGLRENSGLLKTEICQVLIYLHSIQDFKTPLLCWHAGRNKEKLQVTCQDRMSWASIWTREHWLMFAHENSCDFDSLGTGNGRLSVVHYWCRCTAVRNGVLKFICVLCLRIISVIVCCGLLCPNSASGIIHTHNSSLHDD